MRRAAVGLLRDQAGLSSVEYMCVLVLLAVGALGSWRAFGAEPRDRAERSEVAIRTMEGTGEGQTSSHGGTDGAVPSAAASEGRTGEAADPGFLEAAFNRLDQYAERGGRAVEGATAFLGRQLIDPSPMARALGTSAANAAMNPNELAEILQSLSTLSYERVPAAKRARAALAARNSAAAGRAAVDAALSGPSAMAGPAQQMAAVEAQLRGDGAPDTTWLDPFVNRWLDQAPALKQKVVALIRDGWVIGYGDRATRTQFSTGLGPNRIVIEQGMPIASQVTALAHEVGHAWIGTYEAKIPVAGRSKEEWIQANVDFFRDHEGAAVLSELEFEDSVAGVTVPNLPRFHSRYSTPDRKPFRDIYNRYKQDGDREKAIDDLGDLYMRLERDAAHLGGEHAHGTNYREFYERQFDQLHEPTRRKEAKAQEGSFWGWAFGKVAEGFHQAAQNPQPSNIAAPAAAQPAPISAPSAPSLPATPRNRRTQSNTRR